ncbi:hypothetical protein DSECCO2_631550 [anaerobic digester metagenome]
MLSPLQPLDEQVGIAESDGVRVVDVVGHDVKVEVCLVVGRPQRLLHLDSIGDIGPRADDPGRPAVVSGKHRVLPRKDKFLPAPRDDRVLPLAGKRCSAGDRGIEDLLPSLPGCFRDDGCKPVLSEQFRLPVAEQLATVTVDEPDGMVGVDDDEEDARHVQVALHEVSLFLHLPLPPFELL